MIYNELKKSNLSFVKLFGCVAFMNIEKPLRKKNRSNLKKENFSWEI